MTKTLIANLGTPGQAVPPPAAMTHMEVDGAAPADVRAITVIIDATNGEPACFCLHRIRVIDGQTYEAEESHLVSNMSLIIEYEER